MRILITGTTGYIAKRLALRLLEDDHELVCCVRDLERIPWLIWVPRKGLSWTLHFCLCNDTLACAKPSVSWKLLFLVDLKCWSQCRYLLCELSLLPSSLPLAASGLVVQSSGIALAQFAKYCNLALICLGTLPVAFPLSILICVSSVEHLLLVPGVNWLAHSTSSHYSS